MSHRHVDNFNLNIYTKPLNRVKVTKILGVHFDDRMVFDYHCEQLANKVCKRVWYSTKLRYYLQKLVLNTVISKSYINIILLLICKLVVVLTKRKEMTCF